MFGELERYLRDLEEHMKGLCIGDEVWPMIPRPPSFRNYLQPMIGSFDRLMPRVSNDGSAIVERDEDKFRVIIDVQQFAPEEITVRTDDKCITVEGKHEEKKDEHGYVSRQFVRRYILPKGYDIGHVKPSLSSDGVLTITAPRLALPAPGERIIPIWRSNARAIKAG
ncbi:hypothetical protein KM043_000466 [Ampulex compressa]|nr:hypothetical protein KM043_000466 [Ampulex compressa]